MNNDTLIIEFRTDEDFDSALTRLNLNEFYIEAINPYIRSIEIPTRLASMVFHCLTIGQIKFSSGFKAWFLLI